jgi:hypothetical protein
LPENEIVECDFLAASFTVKRLIGGILFRSVGLLIQVALPCILFSNGMTILKLKGGTNAEMAPQIDYITEVRHLGFFIICLCSKTPHIFTYK